MVDHCVFDITFTLLVMLICHSNESCFVWQNCSILSDKKQNIVVTVKRILFCLTMWSLCPTKHHFIWLNYLIRSTERKIECWYACHTDPVLSDKNKTECNYDCHKDPVLSDKTGLFVWQNHEFVWQNWMILQDEVKNRMLLWLSKGSCFAWHNCLILSDKMENKV